MPLLRQYFTDFSDKACCFEDLKPYVSALSPATESSTDLEEWVHFLSEQVHTDRTSLADVQRQINVFKLQRFSLVGERSPEVEHADALNFSKIYFECLPVGKSWCLARYNLVGIVLNDLHLIQEQTLATRTFNPPMTWLYWQSTHWCRHGSYLVSKGEVA